MDPADPGKIRIAKKSGICYHQCMEVMEVFYEISAMH